MKKYKKLIIIVFTLFCFFSISAYADCVRTPLTPAKGKIIIVETVKQLYQAIKIANKTGNLTISLKDGVYKLYKRIHIIGDNIVVRSYSRDRNKVIIKGKGIKGSLTHIFSVASNQFTIADMTIGWVKHHAIQIHGEKGVKNSLIHNVKFVDTGQQMLKISGKKSNKKPEGGVVEWCLFTFPSGVASQNYTGGIDAHNAKNWIIRNNEFYGIKSPDKGLAEHAIHFWNGSENTLVEKNIISNSDRGIGFGLGKKGHKGGIIRNNMVHTNRDVGIGVETSTGTKIYNNSVYTENYENSIEYRFPGTNKVIIQNNLVNKRIKSRNGGKAKKISNNIDYAKINWFKKPRQGDLHLRLGLKNVLEQGVFIDNLSQDIDCEVRTKEKGVDVGADEYQGEVALNINIKEPSTIQRQIEDINVFINRLKKYVQSDLFKNEYQKLYIACLIVLIVQILIIFMIIYIVIHIRKRQKL